MKQIDERGHACPLPVINAKNALAGMKEGEELTVIVDNEIAVQNLSKLATQKGHGFSSEKKADKEYVVKLVASAASPPALFVPIPSPVTFPDAALATSLTTYSLSAFFSDENPCPFCAASFERF